VTHNHRYDASLRFNCKYSYGNVVTRSFTYEMIRCCIFWKTMAAFSRKKQLCNCCKIL